MAGCLFGAAPGRSESHISGPQSVQWAQCQHEGTTVVSPPVGIQDVKSEGSDWSSLEPCPGLFLLHHLPLFSICLYFIQPLAARLVRGMI